MNSHIHLPNISSGCIGYVKEAYLFLILHTFLMTGMTPFFFSSLLFKTSEEAKRLFKSGPTYIHAEIEILEKLGKKKIQDK